MIWILYVPAAVLVVAVVWWLSRAVTHGPRQVASEQHELTLLRDRLIAQLNELDGERADRSIDAQVAADEELRLSAELAEVVKRLERMPAAAGADDAAGARRLRWATVAAMAVALPAVALGLYVGHNAELLAGLQRVAGGGAQFARDMPPQVMEMVGRLENRLRENPDDVDGWARLGRAYVVLDRLDNARAAYAKAYSLKPDDVEILSNYAWVVFTLGSGETTGLSHELYSKLHKLEPDNPDALWFLGLAAYQRGEFPAAVASWERLIRILPPDSPAIQELQHAVAQARADMQAKDGQKSQR
jgi:cytochrome c-type biogenesis protein CcmH